MKLVGSLIVILLSFSHTFSQSDKYVKNPINIEITVGPYTSIRLFSDGMLCKVMPSDSSGEVIYKFYPMKELEYKFYLQLQKVLEDNDMMNYNSIVEDEDIRVFGFVYAFNLTQDMKIKKILWLSGKDEKLEKIINLSNKLIPKKDRDIFKI